jgi:dihydrofolate reductase
MVPVASRSPRGHHHNHLPYIDLTRTAAGQADVAIAGGASAIQQYLAAGVLDELYLHIVPVVLGDRLTG